MPILTAEEAATILRCEDDDANMLLELPQVDAYVMNATGRDWAIDDPIREEAKSCARMLLVMWHENPGMLAAGQVAPSFGLHAALFQLKMLKLELDEAESEESI